jgi:hypothetical protein
MEHEKMLIQSYNLLFQNNYISKTLRKIHNYEFDIISAVVIIGRSVINKYWDGLMRFVINNQISEIMARK